MSLSEAHTDLSPSRKGHVQTHPFSLERAGRGKSYVMRLKQYRCSELFRHKPWKASCGLGMWTLEKAYVGVGSGLLKVSSPGGHWLPGLLFAFLLSVLFLLTWCILTSARACPGRKDTCGASRFLYLSPTTESDSGDLKIISWVIPEVPLGEPPAGVGLRGQPGPRMFAKVPQRK